LKTDFWNDWGHKHGTQSIQSQPSEDDQGDGEAEDYVGEKDDNDVSTDNFVDDNDMGEDISQVAEARSEVAEATKSLKFGNGGKNGAPVREETRLLATKDAQLKAVEEQVRGLQDELEVKWWKHAADPSGGSLKAVQDDARRRGSQEATTLGKRQKAGKNKNQGTRVRTEEDEGDGESEGDEDPTMTDSTTLGTDGDGINGVVTEGGKEGKGKGVYKVNDGTIRIRDMASGSEDVQLKAVEEQLPLKPRKPDRLECNGQSSRECNENRKCTWSGKKCYRKCNTKEETKECIEQDLFNHLSGQANQAQMQGGNEQGCCMDE